MSRTRLADSYKNLVAVWLVDHNVNQLYGEQLEAYFNTTTRSYCLPVAISEPTKTLETFQSIIDAFADFGLRKEPVLDCWWWIGD